LANKQQLVFGYNLKNTYKQQLVSDQAFKKCFQVYFWEKLIFSTPPKLLLLLFKPIFFFLKAWPVTSNLGKKTTISVFGLEKAWPNRL